jgi:S-adenosylmethionine:tRNA ribosyltransferase-isomerase
MIELRAPDAQRADLPAELRGLRRDSARLCVVERRSGTISHSTVARIDEHLGPGDLLVLNSSRTLPGALPVMRADGTVVQIRPAVMHRDSWDALAVEPQAPHRNVWLGEGETLRSRSGLVLRVGPTRGDTPLLHRVHIEAGDGVDALLRDAEPIRYSYVPRPVPLEHYQTVYATAPGSVETPSAGRHLTWELLQGLRRRGVAITDVVLHCTLSSLQDDEADAHKPLLEEWFAVSRKAATAVRQARRVVAVGTSVVRALESALDGRGAVIPRRGWTELAIRPDTAIHRVDALLTGLHESPASHLDMLGAFVDASLLERAYAEARARGYLWHEFGDAMLII